MEYAMLTIELLLSPIVLLHIILEAFDGPYNRKSDHISEIFYCMKVNSIRD